jgi:replication factor C large subunit
LALGVRNKDVSMYDTLKGFFSVKSLAEASALLSYTSVDYDDFLLSVSDNLPRRYTDPEKLAEAYNYVSQADVFRGRIRTENWHLLRYFYNFLAQAAAVDPESYKPFDFISPPIRIITLFWTKGKRTMLDSICTKIGSQIHVGRSEAKQVYIPYLREILQKKKTSPIVDCLKLTPEEVDFLGNMKMF